MTKKVVSFFQEKIGVTPLVGGPGVTHPIVTPLNFGSHPRPDLDVGIFEAFFNIAR